MSAKKKIRRRSRQESRTRQSARPQRDEAGRWGEGSNEANRKGSVSGMYSGKREDVPPKKGSYRLPEKWRKQRKQALDGYSNAAAFLGDDSDLLSSGTFTRSNLTWDTELLTTAYRSSWLAKRIIDMPSEDMTRAWYTLSTSLSESDLSALQRLEAKHSVKQEMTNAIRWARLYGGSLAVIVLRGEEDRLDQPIDLEMLIPECFQGLLVVDRAQGISPSMELVSDLDDPDFGLPEYYTVDVNLQTVQSVRIHHSRVLRFVGRELPQREMERENYWGASELEHIWDELMKRSATSANIAQLVFQANITTLKMGDFGECLAYGTDLQRQMMVSAIAAENRFRTSYGIQLLSAEDSLENHPYSFSGLSDVYELFMMDMAGAAEIPATKLFGRSPQGFNATGEADLRNYYEMISQLQERFLRPALEKLLPIMAISCWGYVPEDLEIVFEPVMTTSAEQRANLMDKLSAQVIAAFQANLITREEAISELKARGKPLGMWMKLEEPGESGNGADPQHSGTFQHGVQHQEVVVPKNGCSMENFISPQPGATTQYGPRLQECIGGAAPADLRASPSSGREEATAGSGREAPLGRRELVPPVGSARRAVGP